MLQCCNIMKVGTFRACVWREGSQFLVGQHVILKQPETVFYIIVPCINIYDGMCSNDSQLFEQQSLFNTIEHCSMMRTVYHNLV